MNIISLFSYVGSKRAIRVTNHLPQKDVPAAITRDSIRNTILIAHESLLRAGYDHPKIYVAALNPHAGEGGMTGQEEIAVFPTNS